MVQEDNQAVEAALNFMVSSSPALMWELRKLRVLFHGLKIRIGTLWLPYALIRYANSLLRMGDPGDIRASGHLLREICRQCHFYEPTFKMRPMKEAPLILSRSSSTLNGLTV